MIFFKEAFGFRGIEVFPGQRGADLLAHIVKLLLNGAKILSPLQCSNENFRVSCEIMFKIRGNAVDHRLDVPPRLR